MAVVIKAVIPTTPDTSNPEATLNLKIPGGAGQEADGFISAQMKSSDIAALVAGPCTITVTQP